MLFVISLHLKEEVVIQLRLDILVKSLCLVILYLELGQTVGPQQVDESVRILAPLAVELGSLQVEVEEAPEVVDL